MRTAKTATTNRHFDLSRIMNLDYSLNNEFRLSNRAGAYSRSSIILCNTRKSHGLMVCPLQEADPSGKQIVLSQIGETIQKSGCTYQLNVFRRDHFFALEGLAYICDCNFDHNPRITYCMGVVKLIKEFRLAEDSQTVHIRYTLAEGFEQTVLKLTPYISCRKTGILQKADKRINCHSKPTGRGFVSRPYSDYPGLVFELSRKARFNESPEWFYNIEYPEEEKQGQDFREDLFAPGHFNIVLDPGQSITLSVSLENSARKKTEKLFGKKTHINRAEYEVV